MKQEQLIRLPEVMFLTKLGRSTIYENIRKGIFPKPYKPSPGVSGWKLSEINAVIDGEWNEMRGNDTPEII
ncbi:AlpA family phage regulatory protein [Sulfuricurvum sp.]|uniref:helix-turn-helix transcriptional regulator n=1 Tax=Sulfuricurvum sp. TaxID=2025608 RepID=UPI002623AA64|nr:AlpA family phage regulatory protein [Sulfuricurvum sp.]MDD3597660.1 AlpA family phage regulatory protein [Sulfuricurvum sp.]